MHYTTRMKVRLDLENARVKILREGLHELYRYVTSEKYDVDQNVNRNDITLRIREIDDRLNALDNAETLYRITYWVDGDNTGTEVLTDLDEAHTQTYYHENAIPNVNGATIETFKRSEIEKETQTA